MNAEPVLKRWFDGQLRFRLNNRTESESVWIGSAQFDPLEILYAFDGLYEQEFHAWLSEEWKTDQFNLREEILSFSANAGRYADLTDAMDCQQVVPFVGSGMSVPTGLPTWREFLLKISGFTQCDITELNHLLDSSSFEEAADLLAGTTNQRLLEERVEHELRIASRETINGPVCLLPALFHDLVVTTNLDRVLEVVYGFCDIPCEYVFRGDQLGDYRDLRLQEGRCLLKLHGDYQGRQGRVLFSSDYDSLYAPGSVGRQELSVIYGQYNMLFLGCSLGPDRSIRLLIDVANGQTKMPKHFAFMMRPHDDTTRVEREIALTNYGIFPIWYDVDHDQAIMALLEGLIDWEH